ncbi:PAS and ANTAR domain-containing protein [Blastococcus sp. PRF04-17]|uniref:PAS and ANTAR domain-containing protein n=1 Tax=Blastococcus sp. PRF04-17 TaxID=2933797 RepID=UPI001FF37920|nr:PAS and ANTAR domain-containing protein [Blastococcus sp. PRF04-17]UOY00057.1 PAS and ANTAR domain-containing protein [Blastococcus sp. PRF04-17]
MRPGSVPPAPVLSTGRYRFDRRSDTWWWSPEMFTLHGLPPGSPQPDAESCLRHHLADDRSRVVRALSAACSSGRAFVLESRIVGADGSHRTVLLTGEPRVDPATGAMAVEGTCIDLTGCRAPGSDAERIQALQTEVQQLKAAMASRAAIEQAKGVLMLLTNCGDEVAFQLLAHISSHTHRKVRDVATVITESAAGRSRLPDDVRAIIRDACPPSQPLR